MKSIFLAAVGLFAACGLLAQTNVPQPSVGLPAVTSVKRDTPVTAIPNPTNAAPASTSPAPAQRAPGGTEVRNQAESQRLQRISESLTAQKPNPRDLEKHRATGVFPSFFRTIKAGGNPLQLINPFAPVTPDEKDYNAVRSRVFDDPKTHAAPGIDIFSVNY